MSEPGRVILHADMDAFFASVEQRDHPEYRGKPVIVGAASARGVVAAASYEARVFGVRSAMPGFRARELCPQGIFLAGDMKKYAAVSRQVHEVFGEFTDRIEPLALDEAFLDITGSVALLGPPLDIARRLKARVREVTGLAVSVGIAPNKLVAKIACGRGKPDGLLWIRSEEVEDFLAPLPLRAMYGVGPKAGERLESLGLRVVGDLARAPLELLSPVLGRHAEEIRDRARGVDQRPVEPERRPKSIGEESTFSDDVKDGRRIQDALTTHAEAIAARARRAGYTGRTVTLKVKLARRRYPQAAARGKQLSPHELFPSLTRQMELSAPTNDGAEIRRAALHLWEQLGLSEAVRLLGVSLSKLQVATAPHQLDLFAARPRAATLSRPAPAAKSAPSELSWDEAIDPVDIDARPLSVSAEVSAPDGAETRGERLGRTLDAIADKFGSGAVRRAVEDPGKMTANDKKKLGERD